MTTPEPTTTGTVSQAPMSFGVHPFPDGLPDTVEHALELARLDPTDPHTHGTLSAFRGFNAARRGRVATVAAEIEKSMPRPEPVARPEKARKIGRFSREPLGIERPLDPAEVQLLGLMGARRDQLTESEIERVESIGRITAPGSSDRALVEYVLADAVAAREDERAAAEADVLRSRLKNLPETMPALDHKHMTMLAEVIAAELRSNNPDVGEADALRMAADQITAARLEAETAYAAKRADLETQLAELTPAAPAPVRSVADNRTPLQIAADDAWATYRAAQNNPDADPAEVQRLSDVWWKAHTKAKTDGAA